MRPPPPPTTIVLSDFVTLLTAVTLVVIAANIDGADARQYTKCEFAQLMSNYFPDEEVAAWTCIAQFESEFKTDAINPTNADGSADHGIFQINDRYWCGSRSGTNTCQVECDVLRREDLGPSVRCAQIVKDKQGFTAWAVWPKCKGQTASYLDGCDKTILKSTPAIFDIQVRPANRGPGFNQTRITSALRAFQVKDARGPAYDAIGSSFRLNDTRSFNLTSIGAMGFLGARQSRSFVAGRLQNATYLVNKPFGGFGKEVNITSVQEEPIKFVTPKKYQTSLVHLGGMNFLGGTAYRSSVVGPSQIRSPKYTTSLLSRSGGMGFLGVNTLATGRQAALPSRTYSSGTLRNAGGMGFLGVYQVKPISLTFTFGSKGPVQHTGAPLGLQKLPYQTDNRRSSGVLNAMGIFGAEYGAPVAPVKGIYFRTGPGYPIPQGAMDFLGGVSGVSYLSRAVPPSRTQPLHHFKAGSVLQQIPVRSTVGALGSTRFGGSGLASTFSVGGRTAFPSVTEASFPVAGDLLRTRNAKPEKRVLPALPTPIVPAGLTTVSAQRNAIVSTRRNVLDYKPLPLNVQTVSAGFGSRRKASSLASEYSTSRPATSVQITGPAMSYSTGTTFFRIGSAGSPNVRSSGVVATTTRAYPELTTPRSPPRLLPSTPSYSVLQSFTTQRSTNPNPVVRFLAEVEQSRPAKLKTGRKPKPVNKNSRKRVSYGYHPSEAVSAPANLPALGEFNQRGLQFASQISFATPQTQFKIGKLALDSVTPDRQQFVSRNAAVSAVTSSSVGVTHQPPSSSRKPFQLPVVAGDGRSTKLYAGLPESVRQHMPSGYGGVSYVLSNGVMTMIKHYG